MILKATLLSIGFLLLIVGGMWVLWTQVFKPTGEWYDECRALENKIRTEDDEEGQVKELFRLKEFSWHRTTGERMRELALMLEIKYDLKILKR